MQNTWVFCQPATQSILLSSRGILPLIFFTSGQLWSTIKTHLWLFSSGFHKPHCRKSWNSFSGNEKSLVRNSWKFHWWASMQTFLRKLEMQFPAQKILIVDYQLSGLYCVANRDTFSGAHVLRHIRHSLKTDRQNICASMINWVKQKCSSSMQIIGIAKKEENNQEKNIWDKRNFQPRRKQRIPCGHG